MKDKIKYPWTPGPWNGVPVLNMFAQKDSITMKEYQANYKLASKAPEMAELLMKLFQAIGDNSKISDIADEGFELLKEVGYDPTMGLPLPGLPLSGLPISGLPLSRPKKGRHGQ